MDQNKSTSDLLVIGAGISGISTALEAAETGFRVVLIEKNPYIGGRVAQLNQYFPKLCPPTCGLEINIKRLRDNKNIKLYTMTEVVSVNGDEGNFRVKMKIKPRYIKDSCTKIDKYIEEMTIKRKNSFNYGLDENKVVYRAFNNSYPQHYVLDKEACTEEDLRYLQSNYNDMIDLEQKEETIELECKSIVWATGWTPYDANKLDNLSYSKFPQVITNVEFERLASPSGPTAGKILIPGTQEQPKKIVFVQCAGSRDENHLEYCSTICCLASMKHVTYIREQIPDADVHIFYIDIRATGIFEELYTKSKEDDKLHFHRGKVAKVFKDPENGRLIVEAENTLADSLKQMDADLVVLATGMKPNTADNPHIDKKLLDRNGFFKTNLDKGIYGCGVCTRPKDVAGVVQESTGTAIKAIHTIRRAK